MNFKVNNNFKLSNVKIYNGTKQAHINYVSNDEEYGPPNVNDPVTYDKMNKNPANFYQKIGINENFIDNLQGLTPAYIERLKNVSDYKQDNPKISNISLGNYTMGDSGCMISSLMGIYYMYTGNQIDVNKFIKDVVRDDFWNMQTCGNGDLLTDSSTTHALTSNWGLSAEKINKEDIISTLKNGEKVLVNVTKDSPMGSGGPLGHYFVLDHINEKTGEIYIYNPNSKYEGYVTMDFLVANVFPYLNTSVRNGLWKVSYDPDFKEKSQSISANKYNVPDFNYAKIDQNTLETLYEVSQNAQLTTQTPALDLGATSFQNVANFNQYIKDNVNAAGYGTREGVVAAGLSLISGYNFATGKRLRYSQPGRQVNHDTNSIDAEGIVNENFYLDCSSFAWWALYTGGFNIPKLSNGAICPANTGFQLNWASDAGYSKTIENGKPGDFLVYHKGGSEGHIVMIIGSYDEGYYCAEFSNPDVGGQISKKTFSELKNSNYYLMDMEKYYNDSNNVR